MRLGLNADALILDVAFDRFDRNSFCYAAKAHPAFSSSHGLLITYACNSLSFETLLKRRDLYRPVVRVFPLP